MAIDQFSVVLREVMLIHKAYTGVIDTGFLIFSRILGFILIAPVLGRKDIPFNIKLSFALVLTFVMVWLIPAGPAQSSIINGENTLQYVLQIFMNVTVGLVIGFIAAAIMEVIGSAGSLMNNQLGLSSAMMFDPSTRQQVALTEKLMTFMGLMVFFQMGGMYWLISALYRSFEIFPLYVIEQPITKTINLEYLVQITGNCFSLGLVFGGPVLVVTMTVDMILGIVNRAAQQIQVFQLSNALKPVIGLSAFLASLPIFIKLLENYFRDHVSIF